MEIDLFDLSAERFAKNVDLVPGDDYVRGQLFVQAIVSEVPHGGRILDYGCGPGRIARLIIDQGYNVDGFDRSNAMIQEAEKRVYDRMKLKFRVDGNNGDDLESNHYDGIVCSSVIEYVRDPDRLLRNFARALRPGGVMALSYANRTSAWRAFARYWFAKRLPHYELQCNIWSARQMKAVLKRSEFRVTRGPVFLEAAPFDKRRYLRFIVSSSFVGTLGFVVARRSEGG